ncbi:20292_t:CDS:2, partial [Rhizophagus irregularis]
HIMPVPDRLEVNNPSIINNSISLKPNNLRYRCNYCEQYYKE